MKSSASSPVLDAVVPPKEQEPSTQKLDQGEESPDTAAQGDVTQASVMTKKSDSSVSTNNPRDPRYVRAGNAAGPSKRPRSGGQVKPTLPQMAFLGWIPDLGGGGKNRPLSGRVPALDAMADRRVTVTAA